MGDMGGMGMSGGMDMASAGLFTPVNEAIAHGFWYAIAAIVGLLGCVRLVSILQSRSRQRLHKINPHCVPSRPRGLLSQMYATATATAREIAYSQPIYFTGRFSRYFSPLPVGRWMLLAVYWIVILIFLWSNTILKPSDPMYAYKWEKVGFRAAWVSIAQIPFIYLLSTKFNLISLLTGISYERLNWLHRWAARTVFLTVIVHWSFFLREWWLADFVQLEIQMMPMVMYGFGAFGTIAWMILSGFGFFRAMNYEIFVLQHIAAAGVLLWLLFCHVPSYARYNVYMSIGFVAFDWGVRIVWNVLRNTHLFGHAGLRRPGYGAQLETLPGDMVRLTIEDVDFKWTPGQHAFLSVPELRPFEMHPFTIANASSGTSHQQSERMTMLIKAHSGFSKSLHKAALKHSDSPKQFRAFLTGPWGMPPDLLHYDTVILIACASGASFTTPLLENLVREQGCVRTITLHWIIRSADHMEWYEDTLRSLVETARSSNISLQIVVYVTDPERVNSHLPLTTDPKNTALVALDSKPEHASSSSSITTSAEEDAQSSTSLCGKDIRRTSSLSVRYAGRPTVASMIRPGVEGALGETAVVCCGGLAITAQVRTFVATLSDERAVHKGTGAQGIFLFTETYGW